MAPLIVWGAGALGAGAAATYVYQSAADFARDWGLTAPPAPPAPRPPAGADRGPVVRPSAPDDVIRDNSEEWRRRNEDWGQTLPGGVPSEWWYVGGGLLLGWLLIPKRGR